ncbi:hypothetical protein FOA43_003052 [Brettanomyces nanus]|uniref:BZIP domain-containing protein n=1 Tax=Eeniella nana TaxID=13502 RepID=A0A875S465_EENNA|nr:uncharacterized protein FOA43_003052 [Brettanomyces nanus]QPG75693.1 hypothetical protein FOA43_003052 [Brettanomyces nanus]
MSTKAKAIDQQDLQFAGSDYVTSSTMVNANNATKPPQQSGSAASFDLDLLGAAISDTSHVTQQPNSHSHRHSTRHMASKKNQTLSLENFHLDPQDFQNFLMINPPIMEYSPYYYMKTPAGIPIEQSQQPQPQQPQSQSQSQQPQQPFGGPENYGYAHYKANGAKPVPSGVATGPAIGATTGPPGPSGSHFVDNFPDGIDPSIDEQFVENVAPQTIPQGAPFVTAPVDSSESGDVSGDSGYVNGPLTAYPPAPRRRVSISNGQIGQISMIVHRTEAEQDQAYMEAQSQAHIQGSGRGQSISPHQMGPGLGHQASTQLQQGPSQQNRQVFYSHHQPPASPQPFNGGEIEVDKDGIPKRQLLYNNQVIFNPDAGPIPGTAAWKRQRILERNRVAASKCRQKKKNLQRRLQRDVEELSNKNRYLEQVILSMKEKLNDYMSANNIPLDILLGQGDEDFHSHVKSEEATKKNSVRLSKSQKRDLALSVTTDTLRDIMLSDGSDLYYGLKGSVKH